MKTLQKNIWMLHLIFGIVCSFVQISCDPGESDVKHDFRYTNNTQEEISIKTYKYGYEIIYRIKTQEQLKFIEGSGGASNYIIYSDSVIVESGSTKIMKFNRETKSDKNIINWLNYNSKQLTSNRFELYFVFTEDYFE